MSATTTPALPHAPDSRSRPFAQALPGAAVSSLREAAGSACGRGYLAGALPWSRDGAGRRKRQRQDDGRQDARPTL